MTLTDKYDPSAFADEQKRSTLNKGDALTLHFSPKYVAQQTLPPLSTLGLAKALFRTAARPVKRFARSMLPGDGQSLSADVRLFKLKELDLAEHAAEFRDVHMTLAEFNARVADLRQRLEDERTFRAWGDALTKPYRRTHRSLQDIFTNLFNRTKN